MKPLLTIIAAGTLLISCYKEEPACLKQKSDLEKAEYELKKDLTTQVNLPNSNWAKKDADRSQSIYNKAMSNLHACKQNKPDMYEIYWND